MASNDVQRTQTRFHSHQAQTHLSSMPKGLINNISLLAAQRVACDPSGAVGYGSRVDCLTRTQRSTTCDGAHAFDLAQKHGATLVHHFIFLRVLQYVADCVDVGQKHSPATNARHANVVEQLPILPGSTFHALKFQPFVRNQCVAGETSNRNHIRPRSTTDSLWEKQI